MRVPGLDAFAHNALLSGLLSRIGLISITVPTEVRIWVIGTAWQVVRWGALVAFVYLGLRISYSDNAATFTGSTLADLLPLTIYGAGADGVARLLGNLAKPR